MGPHFYDALLQMWLLKGHSIWLLHHWVCVYEPVTTCFRITVYFPILLEIGHFLEVLLVENEIKKPRPGLWKDHLHLGVIVSRPFKKQANPEKKDICLFIHRNEHLSGVYVFLQHTITILY